jgi:hypothetical protein
MALTWYVGEAVIPTLLTSYACFSTPFFGVEFFSSIGDKAFIYHCYYSLNSSPTLTPAESQRKRDILFFWKKLRELKVPLKTRKLIRIEEIPRGFAIVIPPQVSFYEAWFILKLFRAIDIENSTMYSTAAFATNARSFYKEGFTLLHSLLLANTFITSNKKQDPRGHCFIDIPISVENLTQFSNWYEHIPKTTMLKSSGIPYNSRGDANFIGKTGRTSVGFQPVLGLKPGEAFDGAPLEKLKRELYK